MEGEVVVICVASDGVTCCVAAACPGVVEREGVTKARRKGVGNAEEEVLGELGKVAALVGSIQGVRRRGRGRAGGCGEEGEEGDGDSGEEHHDGLEMRRVSWGLLRYFLGFWGDGPVVFIVDHRDDRRGLARRRC